MLLSLVSPDWLWNYLVVRASTVRWLTPCECARYLAPFGYARKVYVGSSFIHQDILEQVPHTLGHPRARTAGDDMEHWSDERFYPGG